MLKDISAIIIFPFNQKVFYKMIASLRALHKRINSVIVFQEENVVLDSSQFSDWSIHFDFVPIKNDLEKELNNVIDQMITPYALFLSHTHCLSPHISSEKLQLKQPKTVLATCCHDHHSIIYLPLFVSTAYIKKIGGFSNVKTPFKEAFLPAWIANIDKSCQVNKEGLIKQAWQTVTSTNKEKQLMIEKYQLEKNKRSSPSLTVLISNYNMEKYVETAVASCTLQIEPFDQILIIDDGSTDNSLNKLLQWDNREQVRLFTKNNGGKAKALNKLLPYVTSEFIVELDADDWLDPNAVSIVKKYLLKLSKETSVLYGNFRRWKQVNEDILFKGISKGKSVDGEAELMSYSFPLGPRIYRTSILKKVGGFPVIDFESGRLYEDVSILLQLVKQSKLHYQDFTIYNIREHKESITKNNGSKWNEFINNIIPRINNKSPKINEKD
ncbi:MAG: glycosyltransferase family 2 protein [Bacillota bacterium]|uniref:Glycosyltransferase family 2 protein n=1 Tax=Virgibacillus salarius TaxID=447199 RepID=A0A941DV03_9BACI|nr:MULTISPECIES: glycosyltransferase family A protein [Bacillaceae]NAZ09879.1 glycosyltransferase [Agaribacter marinus]MBR7797170.1 glycosyltransferase family 2 protein [Virgibacillus salarius]MCC2251279.1 glycosyltransferase family 2 protein [Virgibacillus sp. AGTR]MDY7043834.1 glycosyltransferase family A protein [Virgibacillus sp. M23]QRZ19483.1 glycosyltransferase family 2 protein [Virgibacillus sp. AGTR]